MAIITAYWVYAAILVVGIIIGRMWGRNSVMAEIQQSQYQQAQMKAFQDMMSKMGGTHE